MPYGGGDLYVKVELYINGEFVEVTTRARGGSAASGVEIERGRGTGALQAETSICKLTLGNDDGFVTEGNPFSPWNGYFGRGCRIRVSIADVAVSDVVRFDGEIDTIVAVYPGGSDSSVRITATGILGGQLGLGSDPLNSALYRTMSGVAPGDYVPHAYWSLEDGRDASQFASPISGVQPMTLGGAITLGTSDVVPGSLPLPVFDAGSNAVGSVPAYADTGQWVAQAVVYIPTGTTGIVTVMTSRLTGGAVASASVGVDTAGTIVLGIRNSAGSLINVWTDLVSTGLIFDRPLSIAFSALDNASGTDEGWSAYLLDEDGTVLGGISELTSAGNYGLITDVTLNGIFATADGVVMGHVGVWIDPAFSLGADEVNNARAIGGHAGETVDERLDRLSREEGIAITITGTSAQTMGPQRVDTLANLLIDGEAVDGGLLSDGGDGGGLTYRCLSSIVSQSASLAVTQGSLDPDVAPIWDNRNIRNDWTVSRAGGSSARYTDEAHIARTRRRIKDSDTINVETDATLMNQAAWRVNIGTADGPRYNGVGINLRNDQGKLLADAVLALEAGDRFTAADAALPSQHPPGGIDGLVVGWREELDKDKWIFSPNVVPYAPYQVGVYGVDPGGVVSRYGAATTVLAEDLTDVETAADIDSGGETWPTGSAPTSPFPFDVMIGGLTYSCTGVSGTNPNYTLTLVRLATDKAHSSGDAVTLPADLYAL